ncbi:hypothetical protein G6F37_005694 [Rhizopus arrhizus]|nr:hypothetical protein G6F38_005112 [Rhizopus arrhizus]KAG1158553.1 hypothetical protein G6F37_005694 [Rhizopus arrhizus]
MTSIPSTAPTKVIRYRGAVNICLGILKLSFMALFIDPLLPQKPIFALYYAWFHPISLLYTVLYGIKVYCILGVVDIGLGVEQIVTGWEMIQLFDSPVLSTSPRDFWSRRWNRIVRNVLHTKVFSVQDFNNKKQKEPEIQKVENMTGDDSEEQEVFVIVQQSKSTRQQKKPKLKPKVNMFGRGLVTFFVSGLFHEMIIMSTCRKITLENLTFFLLQGFVVALEVALRRQGLLRKVPQGKTRVFCIMAQLIFMAITGRLFLGPFLRYEFI